MNVIFPMYFGEKRGCSSAGSSSSSRKLKFLFSCYTYALEWGQQQCPCKVQLLVFLNTPNTHPNIEHFKPKIDKKKLTVGNTPYLESLHLKIGCRVMLTINLDVKDGLCNGSMGTLLSIVVNESKDVTTLLVKFDDCNAGREMRISNPQWSSKFPDCTPLKKQIHKYSTSRSLKG